MILLSISLFADGTDVWISAENAYNEKLSKLEGQIIARLRDRLGNCKNANEMFRVFKKFNSLFIRQKIRGAIQEYQTQLIDGVKEDIKKLQDKFKEQYRYSEAYRMGQLRDISPVSGAIMWSKQIDQQLTHYMKKVEDVLGKGWELYAEGQKLQSESAAFRKKLDTRPIFDAWLADITKRDLQISGFIFSVQKNRLHLSQLQLVVNFDQGIIQLFKEVRNLLWLNFPVPHSITNLASDAKWVYPHAVSLNETVRLYYTTLSTIQSNEEIDMLVAGYQRDIQGLITKGLKIKWEFFLNSVDLKSLKLERRENRHVAYIRELSSIVSDFNEKTNLAVSSYDEIKKYMQDLEKCEYNRDVLAKILDNIQKTVRLFISYP